MGDNLFHTFEQFSVDTGGQAFFNNSENISNIFSRVTGGQLSNIDGLIRANGAANLFLINPAGIMFGDNASLAIGGSFYGTTADSILFENGEFSAIAPETPTLIINAPIGFTFRDNPAAIAVEGNGQTPINSVNTVDKSFNLIGGDINLDRARVSLKGGSINLISISQAGAIALDENQNPILPENIRRGNISLNSSIVQILAFEENSGDINLTASNLSLSNTQLNNISLSRGNTIVTTNAGNINIDATDSVDIGSNSTLLSNTFTSGNAGNITIDAGNNLTIQGTNQVEATISSSAGFDDPTEPNFGSAGDIKITANNISLDGAVINSDTLGSNNGGNISFQADNLNLDRNSNISASVGSQNFNSATGNGGQIEIDTGTLSLTNGAIINTQTFALGNAGRINIDASESVSISGVAAFSFDENNNLLGGNSSGLISNTEPRATGMGGEITVTTPLLQLNNGGVISVRSRSESAAGNINVDTDTLGIAGGSQILATAFAGGNAGNINLDVEGQLAIAGSDPSFSDRFITVEAATDFNQAQFTIDPVSEFSGVFANTDEASTALGGNISIGRFSIADDSFSLDNTQFTSEIVLSDRGQIAVDSAENGNGGNISLNTERLTLDGNSTISARAIQGDGGNININTNDGFVVAFSNTGLGNDIFASASGTGGNITIAAESVLGLAEGIAFGNDGNRLNNNANDLDASGELESGTIEIDASEVNPLEKTPQLSANTIQAEQNISQICNSGDAPTKIGLIFNGKGGVPPEPTAPLTSDELLITEKTSNSDSYNPPLTLNTSIGKIIPAMGAVVNPDGTVSLVGYVPTTTDRDKHNVANCRFPQFDRH